jgi:hypothetical protein
VRFCRLWLAPRQLSDAAKGFMGTVPGPGQAELDTYLEALLESLEKRDLLGSIVK